MNFRYFAQTVPLLAILSLAGLAHRAAAQNASTENSPASFRLSSATFASGSVLPISMIDNNVTNGVNSCSINGAAGGDTSPQLSWTHPPAGTQSFAVVLYDATASFTHWGMYNIAGNATGLPANAGSSGSIYGTQIVNDFGAAAEYDGPCPPAGVAPDSHDYVFTVYALDSSLSVPSRTNFPANAETLEHALYAAAVGGHVLGSTTLSGTYSATPAK